MNPFSFLQQRAPGVLRAGGLVLVPFAALLSFSVQPIVGKLMLPAYGGTPACWIGSMLFFQAALLGAYALAWWLTGKQTRLQSTVVIVLAALSVLALRFSGDVGEGVPGVWGVFVALSRGLLPATILLFSASPLMHGWLGREGRGVPYYVYAISNAGSLAGVLLYPFWIERLLPISVQVEGWSTLFILFCALFAVVAYAFRQQTSVKVAETLTAEKPPAMNRLSWFLLSAGTCAAMLAATQYITAEIGSTPVAWVGPFGLYLASFMLVFSGLWRAWLSQLVLVWLGVSLYLFMVLKGVGGQTVSGSSVLCLLSLSGAGSFLGNALLHELRPARRFDLFYLVLAAGGVAGGLCTAFLFPALLSRPFEFITISTLLLIAGASRLLGLGYSWRTPVLALLLAAPVLVLVWRQDLDFRGKDSVFFYRNLFGSSNVRLEQHGAGVVLTNETTAHGSQLIQTPEARRHPTLYYSDSTPAGVVLQRLQADRPAMQVGVIGLGAGTLAAYSRAGDTYRFWDIDPKALEIARRHFFYLSDARGKVETVLADGRRGIRESKTDFDLLLIDAFSGDGIPAHLVTTEAINLYFQHLLPRNGLLLIHASNRNSDLFPVVAATARRAGYSTLNVSTEIRETAGDRDWDPTLTHYIIVCRHEHIEELISWFPLEEEGARVRRTLQRASLAEAPGDLVWTDDRNSSLEMLNLKAYLTPQ